MDIIGMLIWVILLVAFAVWFKLKLPQWIGKNGERFVNRKLRELDPTKYKVLDDLLLPSSGNTKTTQIDHVVVSNYGIFCIETKAHKGWIFGNANDQYWRQIIYKYKGEFYNPLRQNYVHVKALEALIKPQFPSAPIFPFIIFPSASKLKISGTTIVGNGRDTIAKIKTHTNSVISDIDRDKIYEILNNSDIKDKESRKLHIKDARELKNSNSR